jgi:hypothetical protein
MEEDVISKLQLLKRDLIQVIKLLNGPLGRLIPEDIEQVAEKYIHKIPAIHKMLWEDADAIFKGDPAA